jgi:hypothetical protein
MTTFTFRRTLRMALVVTALSLALPQMAAHSGTEQANLVRVLSTSNFAKPSTDPSGLTYLAGRKALVIVDSEVEETSHWAGANVWFVKPGDRVIKMFKTTAYSSEPTDVALGGAGSTLYITDDSADRIFAVRKGGDARWGTSDDVVSQIPTRSFNSRDPAGIAFAAKSLWVTDGDNETSDHRVYRLRPGPNGVFDGAGLSGDDVVTSFDTLPLGISKPSDIVFRPGSRHLFLVSASDDVIVETTLTGVLVRTLDISNTSIISPAGISFGAGSEDPTVTHLYVADRGIDNDGAPNENDGRLFEFAV